MFDITGDYAADASTAIETWERRHSESGQVTDEELLTYAIANALLAVNETLENLRQHGVVRPERVG